MNEIEKARSIQDDCVKNHLIPPILAILKIEKIKENGEKETVIFQKSNSYVRNSYNLIIAILCGGRKTGAISSSGGTVPIGYSEDTLGMKSYFDSIFSLQSIGDYRLNNLVLSSFKIGSDQTTDTMNDYKLGSEILNVTYSSPIWVGRFEGLRYITEMFGTVINTTSTTINVREVAAFSDNGYFMLLRDVFETIQLAPQEGIVVSYTLELSYPS